MKQQDVWAWMRFSVAGVALLGMPSVQAQSGQPLSNHVTDKVVLGHWAIDRSEVTIGQFERYVRATGTMTRAEKEGGGFEYGAGWERRPGWSWRKPDGVAPVSADLPAVHLDFAEAQAYCRWAGEEKA